MSVNIEHIAEYALSGMTNAGFEHAQVSASISEQDELNIQHSEPSLLRSTEDHALSLMGIVDGRKASMALTDLTEGVIDSSIQDLFERTKIAPQDEANSVSSGQTGHFKQGPVEGDMDLLALKVEEILEFRSSNTPLMHIEEGAAVHRIARETLLTSSGSKLSCEIGSYNLSVMGTASDGDKSSSFNYTGGTANDLASAHASELFGIGDMLRETERQIDTKPIGGNFTGDIILAPTAAGDLLGWLISQLSDMALISDSSVFKDQVGKQISDDQLTIRSCFDAPGHAAYTRDGFVAEPLTLIENGKLSSLLPSLYGSKKTGIKHVPCSSGWTIDAGDTAKADMISAITRGAMVNRLSMGQPGPNGDFSGVIKNSFEIKDGNIGQALSETMIAGNMTAMLNDIVSISSEHIDLGGADYPWIRIANLNFS